MSTTAWIVGIHMISSHFGACYEMPYGCHKYEAFTPGVYAQAPSGLTFGMYRNSYARTSAYAGWTFTSENGRWSFTVGAVTGYPERKLQALALPSMRVGLSEGSALRVSFVPKVEPKSANTLHLSMEWTL
jgi:hypothetical protein